MYAKNGGEPSLEGDGSPSFFISKRILKINEVNIKVVI